MMTQLTRYTSVGLFVLSVVACDDADSETQAGNSSTTGGTAATITSTAANAGKAGSSIGGGTSQGQATAPGGTTSTGGTASPSSTSIAIRDPNSYGGTMSDTETPVAKHGKLHVSGTALLDEHDVPVQLKGPSSMWLNWENTGYASDPDGVRLLRNNWKATVIRAAMGVDASGAYLTNPDAMKTRLRAVVDLAIQLGIYVIIDWHDHTAETHVDQAVAFFTEMASLYGDVPNVIYETYNEPLKVDWTTVVKPYHETVVAAIRAVDPDNVIILGTPNWSQYVDVAAAAPVAGTNLMYTLHFYSCTHTQSLRNRAQKALDLGLPLFVTEWGATNADGGTTGSLCLDEAQLWHDFMNERKIGWAAWKFDDCKDLSCFFKPGTPKDGTFTDDQLNGQGSFVRERMREQLP